MLTNIDLTINRNFPIKNFRDDKNAVLTDNPGLRYHGLKDGTCYFDGNYYLKGKDNELIESFNVSIIFPAFDSKNIPIVITNDDKVEKSENYHNSEGGICFEHPLILNKLAGPDLRLYDFINYFFPRYFSWVLLKKSGKDIKLNEWAHGEKGTIQVYEQLLNSNDRSFIKNFLINYVNGTKNSRNKHCYCGSGKKIKKCHYKEITFLNYTTKSDVRKNIDLF